DEEAEDAVAEELQPLVVLDPFAGGGVGAGGAPVRFREGAVGQRLQQQRHPFLADPEGGCERLPRWRQLRPGGDGLRLRFREGFWCFLVHLLSNKLPAGAAGACVKAPPRGIGGGNPV